MAEESGHPLSELAQGETVQATITGHEPWDLMAELGDYEGDVRVRDHKPWIWADLTAPGRTDD